MPPIVRFAPSPTGRLHLGNARTALINALFAHGQAGRFILRIDDTDQERSRPEYEAAIREDLGWLGMAWDEEHRQSERSSIYAEAVARLKASDMIYPAFETAEELSAQRARQRAEGRPPRYRPSAAGEGRAPHWRFRLPERSLAFADLIHGAVEVPANAMSDPIVAREDGSVTYLFASIVDDLDLGVTHVIRGEDHLTNTVFQLAMAQALGGSAPAFAHLPLVQDADGAKLSKRAGAESLGELRGRGVEPLAIAAVLTALGTGHAAPVVHDLGELHVDLGAYGRAPPHLDPADIERLSVAILRTLPLPEAQRRLAPLPLDAAFWGAVRGNLDRIGDAQAWWRILHEPLAPVIEDPALLATAADLLPETLADAEAATAWLKALAQATGRKGRALYHPLRLALTAREHGPELKSLLTLMSRERASSRLRGQTA